MAQVENNSSNSRALSIFLMSLKTESTKDNYMYWLNRYMEHYNIMNGNYDDLLKDTPQKIQTDIENYVMELRRIKATKSMIKTSIYALFHFFAMNRVTLNERIIRKLLPEEETKSGGGNAYSTEDVTKIIKAIDQTKIKKHKNWHYKKPRAKALVHFLAASGVRLGAIPELKFKDIKPIEDCYSVTVYAGTRDEYTTFITPEARKALDEYLSIIDKDNQIPESSLFGMSYDGLRLLLYRLVKKANISKSTVHEPTKYDSRINNRKSARYRLDIPTVHGLRKRWNTILKSNKEINPNLIEMMLGHSTIIKLDESYLKPTKEKLFFEYRKGIFDLTVFDEKPLLTTL